MEIEELREYLKTNNESFAKWGHYVAQKIHERLKSIKDEHFIKIPVEPRVKKIDSAIGKAARKGYTNLNQFTDLVGVRFVVLLSAHIDTISEIIEAEQSWVGVLSKDVRIEIDKNPKIFDYQSQHYEIRPKNTFEFEGVRITQDVCCEVQIRSLLQHAYAEIVHDNLYKPAGPVPVKAERQVAKSMALMETTDDLFCNMMKLLTETNQTRNNLLVDLNQLYREKIGGHLLHPDAKTCYAVLDEYRDLIHDGLPAEIGKFVSSKSYITKKIKARNFSPFFSQPVVLFVYWLVNHLDINDLKKRWPLPGYVKELEIVLSDLDAG